MAGDCSIYISDGDAATEPGVDAGDVAVTGVEVAKKATLTLEDNLGATGCIRVDNDIVNDGTLTTATQGGSIALYMNNYFGSGPIDTSGGDTNPDGGNITLYADTAIYNEGNLNATGADSTTGDGGNGGHIGLYVGELSSSGNNLWNRGKLETSGGASKFDGGMGGDGGDVTLYGVVGPEDVGSLISIGKIDTTGGDGVGGGGHGGYVGLNLEGPPATETTSNDIFVLTGIDTSGGAVTGANGDGGDGGGISMAIASEGGRIQLLRIKRITTTGGDGAEGGVARYVPAGAALVGAQIALYGNDNRGGDVVFDSCSFLDETCYDVDITNQAAIDASGGDALVSGFGGRAGFIGASVGNYYGDSGVISNITNSGDLTANGGSGVDGGARGGPIILQVNGDPSAVSSVTNSGKLTSLGGDATGDEPAGQAGPGGVAVVAIDNADGTVSNTGAINVSGGKSTHGDAGWGGGVYIELYNAPGDSPDNLVSNTAGITTNGGVGVNGGYGGYVEFGGFVGFYEGAGVESTNSGSISAQGGAGEAGDGGEGGYVEMYGEPLTNEAGINVSGGNGDVDGGDGGNITLYSTGETTTDNTGKLTSAGGSGKTGADGDPGIITIDGDVQQP